ncbi:MAG: PilZ domain-containing protein [Bdellovibrionales bacterium]|nr:PilZ domain-containing protein [Bdellovibrionales bacterium]
MAELAKKFVEREPRYILRASDNKFLRFAIEGDKHHIYTTTLVNISITGLAFICTKDQSPKVGELIKMEFPIPGGEQAAWWGKVVRIEKYRLNNKWQKEDENFAVPEERKIAVKFENLPEGHITHIKEGLKNKAQELARHKRFQFKLQLREEWLQFLKEYGFRLIIFGVSIVFTFLFLYLISMPTDNYTAERGAPWGQRFK